MYYFFIKLYLLLFAGLFVFWIPMTIKSSQKLFKNIIFHNKINFNYFVTTLNQKDVDFADKSKQRHLSEFSNSSKLKLPRKQWRKKSVKSYNYKAMPHISKILHLQKKNCQTSDGLYWPWMLRLSDCTTV